MSLNSSTSTSDTAPHQAVRTVGLVLLGLVLTLVACELLLRCLPIQKGIYGAEPDDSWPLHRLIPNSEFTYSMAWNARNVTHGKINSLGYAAPFDYPSGQKGIVVLGDSFVESLMNDYPVSLPGRLPALLAQPQPVMQFGTSGSSLTDYLATAQLVKQHFAPDWGVIVVSKGDFIEGFAAGPGYYRWAPSGDALIARVPLQTKGRLESWLRQLALVRYLRGNLKFSPTDFVRPERVAMPGEANAECAAFNLDTRDQQLVHAFVQRLPTSLGLAPERVVLLFDYPERRLLYAARPGREACETRDSAALKLLRVEAAQGGLQVIDLKGAFTDFVARNHRQVDYSPLDAHWNADGHAVAAAEVARVINRDALSKQRP